MTAINDASHSDTAAATRVRSFEEMRCNALQTRDTSRLADLLDPGFEYVHASGRTEDRTAYLEAIADPHTTYGHFVHSEVDIRILGECALMGGVLTHSKTAAGQSRCVLFRFTAAWATHGSDEWKLVRWHNTKIAPV